MRIRHLEIDYIDDISLALDEDVYGANGDLDEFEIRDRLMEHIIAACDYSLPGRSGEFMSIAEHMEKPAISLWQAASLILGVWGYKDRQYMEQLCRVCDLEEAATRWTDRRWPVRRMGGHGRLAGRGIAGSARLVLAFFGWIPARSPAVAHPLI